MNFLDLKTAKSIDVNRFDVIVGEIESLYVVMFECILIDGRDTTMHDS